MTTISTIPFSRIEVLLFSQVGGAIFKNHYNNPRFSRKAKLSLKKNNFFSAAGIGIMILLQSLSTPD
jgi:hypothetical protein